jgi:hypothetical protein
MPVASARWMCGERCARDLPDVRIRLRVLRPRIQPAQADSSLNLSHRPARMMLLTCPSMFAVFTEASMRIVRSSLSVCLAILFVVPTAGAQDHVISKSALDKAIQERVSNEQADRAAILSLLQREDVRDLAAKAGLTLEKARAAVATLQGDDLKQAAAQARQAQNDLAGGGSTIVISTTTIIIALLIVILIVVLTN